VEEHLGPGGNSLRDTLTFSSKYQREWYYRLEGRARTVAAKGISLRKGGRLQDEVEKEKMGSSVAETPQLVERTARGEENTEREK